MLRTLTHTSLLLAVALDPGEHSIFLGTGAGDILQASLVEAASPLDSSSAQYTTLRGHTGAVHCLAVSPDATLLVSGKGCIPLRYSCCP